MLTFLIGLILYGLTSQQRNKRKTENLIRSEINKFDSPFMANNITNSQFKLHPARLKLMNTVLTSYSDNSRITLERLISRKAEADDPELISLVRDFMDPPSPHQIKPVRNIVETPQSIEALRILNDKVYTYIYIYIYIYIFPQSIYEIVRCI